MWLNSGNEFRFAHRTTNREWTGSSLPTTYFVGEGAGIGAAPSAPANFKAHAFDLSETFHARLARNHVLKAGVQWTSTSWTQSYSYGRNGIFQFGNLDQFGNAEGTYFRTVASVQCGGVHDDRLGPVCPGRLGGGPGHRRHRGDGVEPAETPYQLQRQPHQHEHRVPERLQPAEQVPPG